MLYIFTQSCRGLRFYYTQNSVHDMFLFDTTDILSYTLQVIIIIFFRQRRGKLGGSGQNLRDLLIDPSRRIKLFSIKWRSAPSVYCYWPSP